MRKIFILLILFSPQFLFSQDSLDFYPFHVGDIWQYHAYDDFGDYYWNRIAGKDSIDEEGNRHLFFRQDFGDGPGDYLDHWMIDTSGAIWSIEEDRPQNTWRLYKFDTDVGELFASQPQLTDAQSWSFLSSKDTVFFLAENRITQRFDFFVGPPEEYPNGVLQLGWHVVQSGLGQTHESSDGYYHVLTGAIIDSVQYGTIVGLPDKNISKPPTRFELFPAYPNPFNGQIKISFLVTKSDLFTIDIYNVLGQRAQRIAKQRLTPGQHSYDWKALNEQGNPLPSGLYIVIVSTKQFREKQKILYLK